jgi:transposase InsO family protein
VELSRSHPLTITTPTIQKFFWQNIICRFRVPKELTLDNGKQFNCYSFMEYFKTLGTQVKYSSVHHPQSNGVVERGKQADLFENQEVYT